MRVAGGAAGKLGLHASYRNSVFYRPIAGSRLGRAPFNRQVQRGTSLFATPEPSQVPGEVVYRHGGLADGLWSCCSYSAVLCHLLAADRTSNELGRDVGGSRMAGCRLAGTATIRGHINGRRTRAPLRGGTC